MIHIVLGMHRSGTSFVARVLHEAGIYMGFGSALDCHKHPRENRYGYYEDSQMRVLNDHVLEHSGYAVKSWQLTDLNVTWSKRHHLDGRMLITARNHMTDWGWKDPRTVLTMPFWQTVLQDLRLSAKIVVTLRNPNSVARSMRRRGNVSSLEHGLRVWAMYQEALGTFLRQNEWPVCVVQYENMPGDLKRLSEFVGVPLDASLYDPAANREDYRNPQKWRK